MNIQNRETSNNEKQCCVDFCTTTFNTPDGEVVNAYKCNRKEFSALDAWSIQKQRRQVAVGSNIVVTGQ